MLLAEGATCLINSPGRESIHWLEVQGLLGVCLGRVAEAEGCEMGAGLT